MALKQFIRKLVPLVAMMLIASAAFAAGTDVTGASTATSLKEWLKLSDDQVKKLEPVIEERITKMDAALDKLDASDPPDVDGFIKERNKIKDNFQKQTKKILTPEQQQQMIALKAEIETSFVHETVNEDMADMKTALNLTDDQMTKLEPAMMTATQGTMEVVDGLITKTKIEKTDLEAAGKNLDQLDNDLDKAIAGVLTPAQMEAYKKLMADTAN